MVRNRLIFGLLLVVLACGLPPPSAEFRREVLCQWPEDDETDPFAEQLYASFQVQGAKAVKEVEQVEEVEAVGDADGSLLDEITTVNEEPPEVLLSYNHRIIPRTNQFRLDKLSYYHYMFVCLFFSNTGQALDVIMINRPIWDLVTTLILWISEWFDRTRVLDRFTSLKWSYHIHWPNDYVIVVLIYHGIEIEFIYQVVVMWRGHFSINSCQQFVR